MKAWKLLTLSLLLPIVLAACSSGEYKLTSQQGEEHVPYEEWNWLPKNN